MAVATAVAARELEPWEEALAQALAGALMRRLERTIAQDLVTRRWERPAGAPQSQPVVVGSKWREPQGKPVATGQARQEAG